jgi:hypothetical protein
MIVLQDIEKWMNKYTREIIIWLVSFGIAMALWYPIFFKVTYFRLYNGVFQVVLIIQLCRWYIFYDQVILFRRGWMKAAFVIGAFTLTAILYIEGLDSLRVFENQSLQDIGVVKKKLNLEEIYNLFLYLKQMTLICMLGMLGSTAMIILKLIYRTLGYGNVKVRKYLGK